MPSASRRACDNRRMRQEALAEQAQGATGGDSAMDSDIVDQEDDNQCSNRRHRRNSSSVDGDNLNGLVALDMNPDVSNLVRGASQMIGSGEQDGTSMAIAAATATSPVDALNLLAASSAMANVRSERAGRHAAHAASELERLERRVAHLELELRLQVVTDRVSRLEDVVIRLVSILRNTTIDTTEVEDMLQNLNI
ncbi:hypothetical protein DHEL01_v210592 [Diaporthe helianthi]|uniref:Uncharacterized protein n=1 Tax=Diaporthe helianthi TaxID=158607 RepID=A0A2P5HL92_DIAHE|nr:hypothetical protein DHEL01_v210592 [Diaporthe helianthi]